MIQQQQPKLYKQSTATAAPSNLKSTATATPSNVRPYDTLGPPSDPIEFPRPQLVRGRRDTVVCYNPITDEHEVLENVLFRDCLVGQGRYASNNNNNNNNRRSPSTRRTKGDAHPNRSNGANNSSHTSNDTVTKAYWPIPYKAKIQTIMGHVEYVVFVTCILFSLSISMY